MVVVNSVVYLGSLSCMLNWLFGRLVCFELLFCLLLVCVLITVVAVAIGDC